MDCAALCLLTAAVNFLPAPDTMNCSYCVESRSSYSDCYDNVIECAYRDPTSIMFCLNVYENADSAFVQHSVRCISYAQFYVTDDNIKQVASDGMCSYNNVQSCECDACRTKTTTAPPTTTTTEHHPKPSKHGRKHKHHSPRHDLLFNNATLTQQAAYREDGLSLYPASITSSATSITFGSFIVCLILARL